MVVCLSVASTDLPVENARKSFPRTRLKRAEQAGHRMGETVVAPLTASSDCWQVLVTSREGTGPHKVVGRGHPVHLDPRVRPLMHQPEGDHSAKLVELGSLLTRHIAGFHFRATVNRTATVLFA